MHNPKSSFETSKATPEEAKLKAVVFYSSVVGIVLFSLWAMLFTDQASEVIYGVLAWISGSFGWFYFLAIVSYLVFVIFIAVSKYGDIKLGPDHAEPEFNVVTWAAMLFAAGIGIDLIFYCIVEPVTQFLGPPVGEGGTEEAARNAMAITYLHWGLSGWGVYSLVGMALAFFSYRYGLPLNIRSSLYPLFGKRIEGPIGNSVDIAAVLGTVFGVATSLGIGIIQLNFGLKYMFGIPEGTGTQAVLAVLIVVFAAISAATGVERGIRRLSEFNMLLAILLMLFVLFSGQTRFLLDAFVTNMGDYIQNFVQMSFNTFAFDPPQDWLNAWTIFFWAWWIAWGPFVGLFLARISRGRTIRGFVAGTLILPFMFMAAWMSIMGNSAIDLVMGGAAEFGEQAVAKPGSAIYLFLEKLPWTTLTTIVVTILAIVFFVTSGDSGSLVLSNLTSKLHDPNHDAPPWMRILWAAIIGIVTLALLMTGGLGALQSAVVIMGLPFAFVLVLMMIGLYRALRLEGLKAASMQDALSGHLSGRTMSPEGKSNWAQRLSRAMSFPTHKQVEQFIEERVRPALEAVKEELEGRGHPVRVHGGKGDDLHLALDVSLGEEVDFTYAVWPRECAMPAFTVRAEKPRSSYYRLEPHLRQGGLTYDLMGYTKEQLIGDVVDHFEAHMQYLHMKRELANRTPGEEGEPGAS
ncbi:high-affinity choline transporter BetT [Microbulbifer flavimaris]|uniref:High-affinity choline transporter BetT n=1 Tax=Microbulbifer flavimaris TaxID=1781068 RepID=A0ABX4I405_9GAMM|nr:MULTISPECIES: choline BCCT transporter BetT [Microbulbifer]KUJ84682.1 choline transporter [Microbulbifer sp. ZGT114]PCO06773.1 high-affinity choline transporter BetT [Microbulbifer flavimaris]